MTARDVIRTLDELVAIRGAPEYIRSDNGPEFIAEAIRTWLKNVGVDTLYIEPGAPWQNAYSESFNTRLRDELLDMETFTTLLEARVLTDDYKLAYNHSRPHSALDYLTPAALPLRVSRLRTQSLGALPPDSRLQNPPGKHRERTAGNRSVATRLS